MAGYNSILQLLKNAESLNNSLGNNTLIVDILEDGETKAFILDANAEEQLYEQGINTLGIDIMDYAPYRPLTIAIKEEKGQPTNRVTLRDEGDFESSFFINVGNDSFEIKAGDSKTEELIKKYGRHILGLTDENISKLIWKYIFPDLLKKTKEIIYKNG